MGKLGASQSIVMAGLDPAISRQRQMRGSRPRMMRLFTVIPAKAGIQLHRSKLDPDFRQGDE